MNQSKPISDGNVNVKRGFIGDTGKMHFRHDSRFDNFFNITGIENDVSNGENGFKMGITELSTSFVICTDFVWSLLFRTYFCPIQM